MPKVALVSMPWTSAWMPSIQLSVLRQCLSGVAQSDTYELYVDYAARISAPLYSVLSEAGGMIEEWVFAKHYFESEGMVMKEGFLDEFPSFGLASREIERQTLVALSDVTADYLSDMAADIDWSQYVAVCFSLSIYQTTASLALSRLIKRQHPDVYVVFGGNSCVGPAGRTLLEVSPYVDVVVRGEAEPVFATLIERIGCRQPIDDLASVVFRDAHGEIQATGQSRLYEPRGKQVMPNFDSYFDRFRDCKMPLKDKVWIPFESSRGCWWGEKSQCTFCGLHEIMQYRARKAEDVLQELDYLYEKYGVPRFFATDLIMPQEFYRELLPALQSRPYQLFYELKANVSREMLGQLAQAGVKNVQPGLESLSSSVLRVMKKGQSGTHVVQFLKWAAEYGIEVEWNLLTGTPTEIQAENDRVAENIAALYHLGPPRVIQFELDRYSPIFEAPQEFGISNVQPLYIYEFIYPIAPHLLASLCYRFEYEDASFGGKPPWLGGDGDGANYPKNLAAAVKRWEEAKSQGATLTLDYLDDGAATIRDTRYGKRPAVFRLSPHEACLYESLDSRRARGKVAQHFRSNFSDAARRFRGDAEIEAAVDNWLDERLLYEEDGYVVSVAVPRVPRPTGDFERQSGRASNLWHIEMAGADRVAAE